MIRVSTNTIFERGVFNLQERQSALSTTQNRISTGRKILTPSDDPVAASRSLEVEQSKAINEQYIRNQQSANNALALSETALDSVTSLIQDVKVLTVNSGNASLSEKELKSLANEIRARYEELIGLANSTDGNGQYLFSGYRGSTQPFAETAPGAVAYSGDQGSRLIQISASRQAPVSDSGSDIFQLIPNGNGIFVTAPVAANNGTGIISPGNVVDPTSWNSTGNSRDFNIVFHVDASQNPPATTYDIVDNANNVSLLTGAVPGAGPYLRTYTDRAVIALRTQSPPDTNPAAFDYGAELTISGTPANGDSFTVQASTNVDLFTTIHELATSLENASNTGATGNTQLTNSLNTAMSSLDNSIDNILRVRASVGSRLKEVENAKSTGEDLIIQYEQTLSDLRDLDYAKTISDLTFQQFTLEAAQKSFVRIQGLSLFNFL